MFKRSSTKLVHLLKFNVSWSPAVFPQLNFLNGDSQIDPRNALWFSSELDPKLVDQKSKGKFKRNVQLRNWLWSELTQPPNLISICRLVSGPLIAALIINESWLFASISLSVSAASDWLDGYLAKRLNKQSMMGSYLDPLADKVLIGSTVCALVWQGSLPYWIALPVLGRDLFLVLGTYTHYTISGIQQPRSFYQHLIQMQKGVETQGYMVKPLFISKINTTMQLTLIISCIGQSWIHFPSQEGVILLAKMTLISTLASWGSYTWGYFNGNRVI
eukprot:g4598.t1